MRNLQVLFLTNDIKDLNNSIKQIHHVLAKPNYMDWLIAAFSALLSFLISKHIVNKEIGNQKNKDRIKNNQLIKKEIFESFINFRKSYQLAYKKFFHDLTSFYTNLIFSSNIEKERHLSNTYLLNDKISLKKSTKNILLILENFEYDLAGFLYYFDKNHLFYVNINKYLERLRNYTQNVKVLNHQIEYLNLEALRREMDDRLEEQFESFIEANKNIHFEIEHMASYRKYVEIE